jgi:hypothetical protein
VHVVPSFQDATRDVATALAAVTGTRDERGRMETPGDEPPTNEPELHVTERMKEVEPELGKRGKWVYVGWVALWVIVLALILVAYALLNAK